jgi:hypothetical protein
VTGVSAWLLGGLYLDGWAHRHLHNLESFFTPWHGVLYSGLLASAVFLIGAALRLRTPETPWWRSLPTGYGLSLAGVAVFVAGGIGDLLWHTLLGVEADLEALLSPTHLILAIGGVLIGSGPLRAAWRRPDIEGSLVAFLPMLFSLTFL